MKIYDQDTSDSRNYFQAKTLLYLVSLLRLGENIEKKIDKDCSDRIKMCINLLTKPESGDKEMFSNISRISLDQYLKEKKIKTSENEESEIVSKLFVLILENYTD